MSAIETQAPAALGIHKSPPDLVEFAEAMRTYKARSGRMFPTWSEVLEVLRDLGYTKDEAAA